MNPTDVQTLFAYNRWANGCILDAVASLPPEKFAEDVASSYRSVRDTLTHILSAEWVWMKRCNGVSPKQMMNPQEFPDLQSMRHRWAEVDLEIRKLGDSSSEESLEKVIAYTNFRGEVWRYTMAQIFQHVVNHSTYHRGQVTTLLRAHGANPCMTDYLYYFDVHS
jgi:uncharacterized damage-inducible protein DinB